MHSMLFCINNPTLSSWRRLITNASRLLNAGLISISPSSLQAFHCNSFPAHFFPQRSINQSKCPACLGNTRCPPCICHLPHKQRGDLIVDLGLLPLHSAAEAGSEERREGTKFDVWAKSREHSDPLLFSDLSHFQGWLFRDLDAS